MKATQSPFAVVAIPVKDEAERLAACLGAVADQQSAATPLAVVLLLNNCSDNSVAIAREFAATSSLAVHIEIRTLPPSLVSAGVARRLAMERAAGLVAPDGVLLTTDADSVVPPDWIAANLAALCGADAVAGRAVIAPEEARLIPAQLHEDDARECAYATLLDEIASLLDPDPYDPWPRHTEESGASITVRAATYRRAGGMPAVPVGEDRAFFAALRAIDARVRHAPEIAVTVSGRIVGRAQGGMADTIRRRLIRPDKWLDDRLERVPAAARRARLRRLAREGAPALARQLRLPVEIVRSALAESAFGKGWAELEALSPALRRKPVPVRALAGEIRWACILLTRLHAISQRCGGMPAQPFSPQALSSLLPAEAMSPGPVLTSAAF